MEKYGEIADLLTQREFGTLNAKLLVATGKLDIRYWICAFSVNQHAGICASPPPTDSTGHPITPCHCLTPKHFDGDLSAAGLHWVPVLQSRALLACMLPCMLSEEAKLAVAVRVCLRSAASDFRHYKFKPYTP